MYIQMNFTLSMVVHRGVCNLLPFLCSEIESVTLVVKSNPSLTFLSERTNCSSMFGCEDFKLVTVSILLKVLHFAFDGSNSEFCKSLPYYIECCNIFVPEITENAKQPCCLFVSENFLS